MTRIKMEVDAPKRRRGRKTVCAQDKFLDGPPDAALGAHESGTTAIGFCIIPQSITISHASEYVELILWYFQCSL